MLIEVLGAEFNGVLGCDYYAHGSRHRCTTPVNGHENRKAISIDCPRKRDGTQRSGCVPSLVISAKFAVHSHNNEPVVGRFAKPQSWLDQGP